MKRFYLMIPLVFVTFITGCGFSNNDFESAINELSKLDSYSITVTNSADFSDENSETLSVTKVDVRGSLIKLTVDEEFIQYFYLDSNRELWNLFEIGGVFRPLNKSLLVPSDLALIDFDESYELDENDPQIVKDLLGYEEISYEVDDSGILNKLVTFDFMVIENTPVANFTTIVYSNYDQVQNFNIRYVNPITVIDYKEDELYKFGEDIVFYLDGLEILLDNGTRSVLFERENSTVTIYKGFYTYVINIESGKATLSDSITNGSRDVSIKELVGLNLFSSERNRNMLTEEDFDNLLIFIRTIYY